MHVCLYDIHFNLLRHTVSPLVLTARVLQRKREEMVATTKIEFFCQ